ncbi:cytochrome P450 [Plantactinospora soyae]|uniref:Cytochrome P450 n=1 Tax=Plantactinospora soyae TaxID=1544732 RepID=A0A927M7V4_9ACTN|nr:cytochrome P450 [Plantactinospora soyae]MBE1489394.1 cytochrome P450 [Plantactinospora soyae]
MISRDVPIGCPLHDRAVPLYGKVLAGQTWDRLRDRFGPVAPIQIEPGVAAWLVLGYDECVEVLRNPGVFTHDSRIWREISEGRMLPDSPLMPIFGYRPNVLYADGPEHERLRSTIVDSLARVPKQRLETDIRNLADQLIDRFIADGRTDALQQYARWLPILVMNRIYGMDDRHGYLLAEVSRAVFDADPDAAGQANQQLIEYFGAVVAVKRERPGADVPSWLMEHDAELNDEEMVHQLAQMMLGNCDPTAHLISNTLAALLTDRTFWAQYARSELQVEEAVNRVLWQDPPVPVLPARFARTDTQLRGVPVKAGDALLLGLAAAHGDPVLGDVTGASQSSYVNRAHLAWGAGPHRCPAERLARQIAYIGIGQLLHRIPTMRLAVPTSELNWRPVMYLRGLNELPIEFPPGEPRLPSEMPEPTAPLAVASENGKARAWFTRVTSWLRGR